MDCVGLKHFGEATSEMLVNIGFDTPESLLKITIDDLINQPNWGKGKTLKFISELDKIEKINLLNFVTGLGINNISYEIWKNIIIERGLDVESFLNLINLSKEELQDYFEGLSNV